MKKEKEKSQQKKDKKETEKTVKKANRKQLESSLSDKFKEVIKSLGHEAEVIAKDIERAGKLLARRLSDKLEKKDKKGNEDFKKGDSLLKKKDLAIESIKSKKPESGSKAIASKKRVSKPVVKPVAGQKPSKAAVTASRAAAQATSVSANRRKVTKKEDIVGDREPSSTVTRSKPVASSKPKRAVKKVQAAKESGNPPAEEPKS